MKAEKQTCLTVALERPQPQKRERKWRKEEKDVVEEEERCLFHRLLSSHSAAAASPRSTNTCRSPTALTQKSPLPGDNLTFSVRREKTRRGRLWRGCDISLSLLCSTTRSISPCLLTIYDFFPSLHTRFSLRFDLCVLKCFWNARLLFPPESRLFSYEQRLQRRRGVRFCHPSLSSLCASELQSVSVCGPLQTCRETDYTMTSQWLPRRYLDSRGASFCLQSTLSSKACVSKSIVFPEGPPERARLRTLTFYPQKTGDGSKARMKGEVKDPISDTLNSLVEAP